MISGWATMTGAWGAAWRTATVFAVVLPATLSLVRDAAAADVGGPWWAFEPVKPVEPPADPSGWSEHPIDRFVAASLREQGLAPLGPADKRALVRRVTFDLTGLPPTPDEVGAFLADH